MNYNANHINLGVSIFDRIAHVMSRPTIATVLPTYNRAAYLNEALDSILGQADPPDEIIVVDDGSTDGTADVLAEYGDRIRVLNQDNAGASAARNTGAFAATSDWLTFLDSDDLWLPDRMRLLRADLASADADIVAHVANVRFRGAGEGRDFFAVARIEAPQGATRRCARPLAPFLHAFFLIGAAVRRTEFTALGGFDTSFPTDEDTEMAHRLAARGPFLLRGDAVADVIRRSGDTSALSALRHEDPWLANDLKERHFRGILARSDDPEDRALASAALSDTLLYRAALLRDTRSDGYWAALSAAARAHPVRWKGWAKAGRAALLSQTRRGKWLDRTGAT